MTPRGLKLAGRLVGASLTAGLLWSVSGNGAAPQTVSSDQILKALAPVPVTRSLSGPAQPALSDADRAFIEGLRHRTRSLTIDEDDHVAELAKTSQKIDLEIYFDFNQALVT